DDQVVVLGFDRDVQRAMDRIVLEQVGEGLGVGQVVDRDEFQGRIAQGRTQHGAPDASEPVDADADGHVSSLIPLPMTRCIPGNNGFPERARVRGVHDLGNSHLMRIMTEESIAQVPISHDARYFSCSFVSRSIVTPMPASLSLAISLSMSAGTG